MNKYILIVGGSGYLGKKLANYLAQKDYKVTILSRKKVDIPNVRSCIWDPGKGISDSRCLRGIDVIVNFAGNGIADKLWTKRRKSDIIKSRVSPLEFLFQNYLGIGNKPKKIISASAVGYYGHRPLEELTEKSKPGKGFLPFVCQKWESSAHHFKEIGCKVINARIGVVIASDSGFVTNIRRSQKLGINFVPGKGNQHIPWISLQDLLRAYLFFIESDTSSGIYNLCSPQYYNLLELQSSVSDRKMINFRFPSKLFRLITKDFSEIFLNDMKVLPKKLLGEGFRFMYTRIEDFL